MQTELHYDVEMCIFSWQFPGSIHPFGSCRTMTQKYCNQCKLVTSDTRNLELNFQQMKLVFGNR